MKIQKYLSLSFVAGIAVSLTGCTTLPTIENAWRNQNYLSDKTVNVENTEKTLKKILREYDVENLIFVTGNSTPDDNESKSKDRDKTKYTNTRNAAQDYLKAVSNQNCARFKTQALAAQSNTNFALGGIATTLSTVGSLLTPASTTQALSGASAAVTGIQSQIGENYYREKTFEIITRAMDVRRKKVWADIETRRLRDANEKDYSYTINRALADAIEYNNACSVIVGFEELADSVTNQEQSVDAATAEQKTEATGGNDDTVVTAVPASQTNSRKVKNRYLTVDERMATNK